jgi:hypothetical protein
MPSRPWTWDPRSPRQALWARVRTLATDLGQPVVKLLEVPGAFVPGAPAALKSLGALFGADLQISALDSGEVLSALDGAPGPFASADGSEPVFIEGVKLAITVAHNSQSDAQVLLERLDLHLIEHDPAPRPEYEAAIDAEALFGAGLVEPLRFFVELDGPKVGRARRMVRGADGRSEPLIAESPNFLDTDPAALLALGPKDPPQPFRITVSAQSPGLYRFCLRWFYRVGARELRQHTSLPVAIYRGEP